MLDMIGFINHSGEPSGEGGGEKVFPSLCGTGGISCFTGGKGKQWPVVFKVWLARYVVLVFLYVTAISKHITNNEKKR